MDPNVVNKGDLSRVALSGNSGDTRPSKELGKIDKKINAMKKKMEKPITEIEAKSRALAGKIKKLDVPPADQTTSQGLKVKLMTPEERDKVKRDLKAVNDSLVGKIKEEQVAPKKMGKFDQLLEVLHIKESRLKALQNVANSIAKIQKKITAFEKDLKIGGSQLKALENQREQLKTTGPKKDIFDKIKSAASEFFEFIQKKLKLSEKKFPDFKVDDSEDSDGLIGPSDEDWEYTPVSWDEADGGSEVRESLIQSCSTLIVLGSPEALEGFAEVLDEVAEKPAPEMLAELTETIDQVEQKKMD